MAALAQSFLSLADLYKRTQGEIGEQIAAIIEILNQSNPVHRDAMMVEANMGTIHRHTIRTGLPSVTWGQLYQGIPQSKSTTQQVDETTGFFEALATIDTRLLALSPDEGAVRLSEANPFLEAMAQEVETSLFYHDTATTPEKCKGLSARYNVRGGSGAGNQVIHGGGSGSDNTSIWFVTWGENDTHGIYPKGTMAGVKREDKREQRVTDDFGNPYYVKEDYFCQHLGWCVKDWRNNARIANIDVSAMQGGNVDLYRLMRKAYYRLHRRRVGKVDRQMGVGRTVIYCNRDVLEALDGLASNAGASDNFVRLRPMEIEGEEVLTYRGIPIRETDALLNTEALVPTA